MSPARARTPALAPPEDRVYVYALLGARVPPPRVRGHRIEIVAVPDLHAAVERLKRSPDVSEAALRLQHRIVVLLSKKAEAIIPVRFGAFITMTELTRIVRSKRAALRRALDEVRCREQMTVRVFAPPDRPNRARTSASGTEYLLSRAASRGAMPDAAAAIRRAVRPVVTAERVDPASRGVQVTLNHLIRVGQSPEYRALAARAIEHIEPPPAIAISGPWPPFAFAPELWPVDMMDR